MKRKLTGLILALLLILAFMPAAASAEEVSMDGVKYALANGEASAAGYTDKLTADLVIPETVKKDGTGYKVTSIGEKAFFGNNALETAVLPASLKEVGAAAFYGCSTLKDIYFLGTESQWSKLSPADWIGDYESRIVTGSLTVHYSAKKVTIETSPAGAGKPAGAGYYGLGETAVLEARPDEDHYLLRWTSGGSTVSEKAVYSFSVQKDITLKAEFGEKKDLTIRAKTLTLADNGKTQGPGGLTLKDAGEIEKWVEADGLLDGDKLTSVTVEGQGTGAGSATLTPSNAQIGKDGIHNDRYRIRYEEGKLTIRDLKITFVLPDGSMNQMYAYGTPADEITPPDTEREADEQYTYTFEGWDKKLADVTEDATYTAVYTKTLRQYKVTFVDHDGETVLQEATYDYGTKSAKIELPKDPVREDDGLYSYTFDGWTPELTDVTGDVTYMAVYKAEKLPEPGEISYAFEEGEEVTWIRGSGKDLTLRIHRSEKDDECFSHYERTVIDGENTKVKAKEGSTVITVAAATLVKLRDGTHTLQVLFDDGEAMISLTVLEEEEETQEAPEEEPGDSEEDPWDTEETGEEPEEIPGETEEEPATTEETPPTGDGSHMALWICLAAGSLAGLASLLLVSRRHAAGNRGR